jgi:hypothetical protein
MSSMSWGIVVVEGEHPGSTYYAAELRNVNAGVKMHRLAGVKMHHG